MRQATLLIIIGVLVAGCMGGPKAYESHKGRTTFFYPVRQLPPEPVYNPLRWVYLPDPLPEESPILTQTNYISKLGDLYNPEEPIINVSLKNASIEEVAISIAEAAKYRSYTSGFFADKKISFASSGTIDSVTQQLADQEEINAYVDHANREIRFLSRAAVKPRFFEDSYEYKSIN